MNLLIAEDDPHTRAALVEILSGEGFSTVAVENGRQAIQLATTGSQSFDLICLDVMMPDTDGFTACEAIRSAGITSPILFISAKSEDADQVTGLDLGADDFIVKPFSVATLLARVRAALRRANQQHPQTSSSQLTFGDLTVIPTELRARRGETSIDLSPRDVAILELLHAHRGAVIHRDQLLDKVWGLNYLPNSRCVDQHISQLRKRIEVDPKHPTIIETVHGAGYRYP